MPVYSYLGMWVVAGMPKVYRRTYWSMISSRVPGPMYSLRREHFGQICHAVLARVREVSFTLFHQLRKFAVMVEGIVNFRCAMSWTESVKHS